MMARDLSAVTLETQLRDLSRGPFAGFALTHDSEIAAAHRRFGVGALISGTETGVESAAREVAADFRVPFVGFAPRGFINETGRIRQSECGKFYCPGGPFGSLTSDEILNELVVPPYARRAHFEESRKLNSQFSNAAVVMSSGHLMYKTAELLDLVLRYHDRSQVLVVDLSSDLMAEQRRFGAWLRDIKPVSLYVTGPRESHIEVCGFSVHDRATEVLSSLFR